MIDKLALSSAIKLYTVGFIKGEPEKIRGDVDLNYKIVTEQGTYLLKYIVDAASVPQFEFLGELHQYLRRHAVVVPQIYQTMNKKFVENQFILYEFIDGAPQKEWSSGEIISLVTNFATMLSVLRTYEVPELIKQKDDRYIKGGNIRYCYEVFRPQILQLSTSEEVRTPIIRTIDFLYSKLSDFESLPKSLIDGDLNESNALFKDGKNVGIIDLALSYDPIVYDLGEFCYWYAFPWHTKTFNHERYGLIVKTFEKIIALSPLEKELLPYMILRRSMMDIMVTIQYYWSQPSPASVPEKRLREQIVRNSTIIDAVLL